jgi:hypothetical protein
LKIQKKEKKKPKKQKILVRISDRPTGRVAASRQEIRREAASPTPEEPEKEPMTQMVAGPLALVTDSSLSFRI